MRALTLLFLALILLVAVSAGAFDHLDKYAKQPASSAPATVPLVVPVGGDTIEDAVVILELPFTDSGVTREFNDDYDVRCHSQSFSPDVVYSLTPEMDLIVDIDLCGSGYDTKVFVLDADLNEVACSDDYYMEGDPCGDFNSRLEFMPLMGGEIYYIIVDGWGGEFGEYQILVEETVPCFVECPPEGIHEGEEELHDGYVDFYNAGCYSDWAAPLDYVMLIEGQGGNQAVACGIGGFWQDHPEFPLNPYWDDDWYVVHASTEHDGVSVTVEVEKSCVVYEIQLPEGDCNQGTFLQTILVRPCEPTVITALGDDTRPIYFYITGLFQTYPDYEFSYLLSFEGIEDAAVRIESKSWSSVRSLFD